MRLARTLLAFAMALLAPAQAAAACCLLPNPDHETNHASAAPATHAPKGHVRQSPSGGATTGRAEEGRLSKLGGQEAAPCILPASSPALRERPGSAVSAVGALAIRGSDRELSLPAPTPVPLRDPRSPARLLPLPLRL